MKKKTPTRKKPPTLREMHTDLTGRYSLLQEQSDRHKAEVWRLGKLLSGREVYGFMDVLICLRKLYPYTDHEDSCSCRRNPKDPCYCYKGTAKAILEYLDGSVPEAPVES